MHYIFHSAGNRALWLKKLQIYSIHPSLIQFYFSLTKSPVLFLFLFLFLPSVASLIFYARIMMHLECVCACVLMYQQVSVDLCVMGAGGEAPSEGGDTISFTI